MTHTISRIKSKIREYLFLESTKKKNKKLIIKNEKAVRGTKWEIWSDRTITFDGVKTKSILNISNDLHKWFILPRCKKDRKITIKADFTFTNQKGEKISKKSVMSEIINNSYTTEIRIIDPIFRSSMRNKIHCKIHGTINNGFQLEATELLEKAVSVRKKTEISDLSELTLITSGGQQNAFFEIFRDNNGRLQIHSRGIIGKFGFLTLSGELVNFLEGWFDNEEMFLCSIDNEEPIIVSSKVRRKITEKKIQIFKELNFPMYNPDNRTKVNIKLTSPSLKLNKKTIYDYKLKTLLMKSKVNIRSLETDFNNTTPHFDSERETEVTNVIKNIFKQDQSNLVLQEVEISVLEKNNRKCVDLVIIPLKESMLRTPLILIENKTSTKHSKQTKTTIAELKNLQSTLGNDVIPFIIINYDIKKPGGKFYVTKEFGDFNKVILIGKEEFSQIKNNPELFFRRIKEYQNLIRQKISGNEKFLWSNRELIEQSQNCNNNNKLLEKLYFIETKLPTTIRIRGINAAHSAGKIFEQETRAKLEKAGYEVISNVRLSQNKINIELDHIAIKDNELTIVSCKDRSDLKNPQKLAQLIKESASVLEHRMNLLNFDNALLFVKVMPEYYENMRTKFSNHFQIKNIKIHIKTK